jgi:hypothetical protein
MNPSAQHSHVHDLVDTDANASQKPVSVLKRMCIASTGVSVPSCTCKARAGVISK